MPKIHYFQRYSSVENSVTNNTFQLLTRVYAYSPIQASQLLTELTGEPIKIGIEVNQQERGQSSVPDGAIIQRSFKILIESKVDSPMRVDQLLRHADSFSGEDQKVLLLLTRELIGKTEQNSLTSQISTLHPNVIFKNITYEEICRVIKTLFREYEYEMCALVDDYVEYCNDAGLFDQFRYLMRIVPCGQSLDINRKYGIYFHSSDRGYTPHQYVGIYKNKAVQVLWKIESVFDIEYDGTQINKKTCVQGRETDDYDGKLVSIINEAKTKCGYNIASNHRFFCGTPIETNFVKSSSGGMQGARLMNLREIIGEFNDASNVAQMLRNKQWD